MHSTLQTPTDDAPEYRGEVKPRRRPTAVVLTFLCPGLGHMYIGQLFKGVTITLAFLLLVQGFVIVFSVLKFFPLLPFLVTLASWLVFTSYVAHDVVSAIRRHRLDEPGADAYVLRGYNHWMVYGIVLMAIYLVPLYVTGVFVSQYLLGFERIESAVMFPTVKPGDTLLIDRSAYRSRVPQRGELVAVRTDDDGEELSVLRVVAVPGDVVSVEGETVYVNDAPLARSDLAESDIATPAAGAREGELLAMVEHNHGHRYVISVSPRAFSAVMMEPTRLEPGQLFVLADNRSQVEVARGPRIRDSRNFGALEMAAVAGKPLYIAWSASPETGELRLDRVGLRTQ